MTVRWMASTEMSRLAFASFGMATLSAVRSRYSWMVRMFRMFRTYLFLAGSAVMYLARTAMRCACLSSLRMYTCTLLPTCRVVRLEYTGEDGCGYSEERLPADQQTAARRLAARAAWATAAIAMLTLLHTTSPGATYSLHQCSPEPNW